MMAPLYSLRALSYSPVSLELLLGHVLEAAVGVNDLCAYSDRLLHCLGSHLERSHPIGTLPFLALVHLYCFSGEGKHKDTETHAVLL